MGSNPHMNHNDANSKRAYLKTLYSGPRWSKKVDAMPDNQVYAVYMNAIRKQNAVDDKTPAPIIPKSLDPEQLQLNL